MIDLAEVKRHIKPKADSTLLNMKKEELIKYVRCLEHNCNVANSFIDQQAKNFETILQERDAAIKDIERNLKGMDTHSCQMCAYYKDCKRNSVQRENDAKWRGVRED